jgi:hypothetical protein
MTAHTKSAREAFLDGRQGEPDEILSENFLLQAEWHRRTGDFSQELMAQVCDLAAARIRRGERLVETSSAADVLQRCLHRILLQSRANLKAGPDRDLWPSPITDEALADIAEGTADCYRIGLEESEELRPLVCLDPHSPGGLALQFSEAMEEVQHGG